VLNGILLPFPENHGGTAEEESFATLYIDAQGKELRRRSFPCTPSWLWFNTLLTKAVANEVGPNQVIKVGPNQVDERNSACSRSE
jgi:hypothetical protein